MKERNYGVFPLVACEMVLSRLIKGNGSSDLIHVMKIVILGSAKAPQI